MPIFSPDEISVFSSLLNAHFILLSIVRQTDKVNLLEILTM